MKADTRLFISHHEGDRTSEDAKELFEDIERKRNPDSQIPLFISDEWDPFEEALLNVYGNLEQPPYKGVGRKPNPVLIPKEELKYAQVCKKRERGSIVGMVKRVVFGDLNDILTILGADSDGKISTSYIERFNLTIRNSLARFIRRTMNFSKKRKIHTKIVDFLQAWYNFVKSVPNRWKSQMDAKNTHNGRGTNRSYLEIGRTVDVQNTCSVIGIHDQKSEYTLFDAPDLYEDTYILKTPAFQAL